MARRRSSGSQFIFSLIACVLLTVVGLVVAFGSTSDMRTIGLMLFGVGVIGCVLNIYLRAKTR